MLISDYQAVFSLWLAAKGIELTEDDNEAGITLYLQRNTASASPATFDHRLQNKPYFENNLCAVDLDLNAEGT
jgi:hypothetical protein